MDRPLVSKQFMDQKRYVVEKGLVTPRTSNEYSKGTYAVPVPEGKILWYGWANTSPAHQLNLNKSLDFYALEGTYVYAAQDGVVVDVKADSKARGMSTKYWAEGNFIEIEHPNGERSHYEHMRFGGVFVKIGDSVKKYEVIGEVGDTGFTDSPRLNPYNEHLHFQINRYYGSSPNEFVTLKATFEGDFSDPYRKRVPIVLRKD